MWVSVGGQQGFNTNVTVHVAFSFTLKLSGLHPVIKNENTESKVRSVKAKMKETQSILIVFFFVH